MIALDGRLYFVSDKGIVRCLKCDSGDEVWFERLPGDYSASPLEADGHLYFFNQTGTCTVLQAGDEFRNVPVIVFTGTEIDSAQEQSIRKHSATIVMKDGIAAVQAGAGIVADSVPEMEYQETLNKARGMIRAIEDADDSDSAYCATSVI